MSVHSDTGIVSKAQDHHSTPLLSVAQVCVCVVCVPVWFTAPTLFTHSHAYFITIMQSAGGLEIRAFNFNQLRMVLNCAGAKKLKELQLCLEGMDICDMYT